MNKKRFIVAMTAVVFISSIIFAAGSQTTKEVPKKVLKLVKKGNAALVDKKIEKALERFNKALEIYPDHAPIHIGFATASLLQNKLEESLKHYAKAFELQPDNAQVAPQYAKILFAVTTDALKQKDRKKAMGCLEKIINIKNIDKYEKQFYPTALMLLGQNAQQYGKSAQSNEYFNKFLALPGIDKVYAAQYNTIHFMVGENYVLIKKYKEAEKYLKKFMSMNTEINEKNKPLLAKSNYYLGFNKFILVEEKCKKIQEDKTIKEVKEKKEKMAKLAKASEGDILPYLNKTLELDANNENAIMVLGNYYARILDYDKAIAQYTSLIDKFPGSDSFANYKKVLDNLKKDKEIREEAAKQSKKKKSRKRRKR